MNLYRIITNFIALFILGINFAQASNQLEDFNPGVNDIILSTAIQPDGKILIGGGFTQVGGVDRGRVARLNIDGSLDQSFTPPNFSSPIESIALQPDGKILFGGTSTFTRLNPNGITDIDFNHNLPELFGTINSIALQPDGKIILGGNLLLPEVSPGFLEVVRLNSNGSLDNSFDLSFNSFIVRAIALQPDGKILIGGGGGRLPIFMARLNADGSEDTSFNPSIDSSLTTIAIQSDGKILIGGTFIRVEGVVRRGIARLNSDGSLDTTFRAIANNNVRSIGIRANGNILVGGNFTQVNEVDRSSIAQLASDGSLDSGPNISVDNNIASVAIQSNGDIVVAGFFTTVEEMTRNFIARLSTDVSASEEVVPADIDDDLIWLRSGGAPEISHATLEISDGDDIFSAPIFGARIDGGWYFSDSGIDQETPATIRLRGSFGDGASVSITETKRRLFDDGLCLPIKARNNKIVVICL